MIASAVVVSSKAQGGTELSSLPSFAIAKDAGAKTTSFADAMQQSAKTWEVKTPALRTSAASDVGQETQATPLVEGGDSNETKPVLQQAELNPPGAAGTQDHSDKIKTDACAEKQLMPVEPGAVLQSHKPMANTVAKSDESHGVAKKPVGTASKLGKATVTNSPADCDGNAPIVGGPVTSPGFLAQQSAGIPTVDDARRGGKPAPVHGPVKSPVSPTAPIVGGPKAPVLSVLLQSASDASSDTAVQEAAATDIHAKLVDTPQAPGTSSVLVSGVVAPIYTSATATFGVQHADAAAAPMTTSSMTAPVLQEPVVTSMDCAKPNQIEVGVRGGEFGRVTVRAELAPSGEVHAFLRGTSAEVTHSLTQQASTIHSYLGAQDLSVKSVQVEAPQSMQGAASSSMNASGGGPQSRQEQSSTVSNNLRGETSEADDDVVMPLALSAKPAISIAGTGNWVSVRA